MFYMMQWSILADSILRVTLWILFLWLDAMDPFVREIHQNEIWKYQYPVTPSYVPSWFLWTFLIVTPLIFFSIEYMQTSKSEDSLSAFLGLTLSYCLTGIITSYIKVIVGRPRPDFYFRCFPDGSGDDFTQCSGEKKSYNDGRKSFPSGHSSLSFASMTFLMLYLIRKFNFLRDNREKSFQLCLCLLPILVATSIAISRTCDYHHHYEDVIAGSLIGSTISYLCFNLYFTQIQPNCV